MHHRALIIVAVVGVVIAAVSIAVTHHRPSTTPTTTSVATTTARTNPTPTSASARPTPSTARTRAPAPARGLALAAARAFGTRYLRFLDGHLPARTLGPASRQARQTAAQAGRIPTAKRAGKLRLVSLRHLPATSGEQVMLTARDRQHTVSAQLTMTIRSGRWEIGDLTPPDLDEALATTHGLVSHIRSARASRTSPAGRPPTAVRRAARAFLTSYLAFSYGHVPVSGVTALTAGLRHQLAAQAPNVPAAIKALDPVISSLTLEHARHRSGWTAVAIVADGQRTYPLSVAVGHHDHRWLARSVNP